MQQGHLCRVSGDIAQLPEALAAAEAGADSGGACRLFDSRVTAVRDPVRQQEAHRAALFRAVFGARPPTPADRLALRPLHICVPDRHQRVANVAPAAACQCGHRGEHTVGDQAPVGAVQWQVVWRRRQSVGSV